MVCSALSALLGVDSACLFVWQTLQFCCSCNSCGSTKYSASLRQMNNFVLILSLFGFLKNYENDDLVPIWILNDNNEESNTWNNDKNWRTNTKTLSWFKLLKSMTKAMIQGSVLCISNQSLWADDMVHSLSLLSPSRRCELSPASSSRFNCLTIIYI